MNNEPLISIIIPVYKVEKYLERCLISVVNQTYGNIEIILVDDGSPDNCGIICDEYAKKDKRIIVIHQKNKGLSVARNNALDKANGKYITFVDSDDFIHKEYVWHMYNLLIEYDCDIVQCAFVTGNASDFSEKNQREHIKLIKGNEWANGYNYKTIACCKLYKKKVFDHIRFPAGKINEDEAIYYKLAYESKKICITDKKLYYYYMSDNSIMRNNRINLDFIDVYEERIKFFEGKKEDYLLSKSYERFAIVLLLYYANFLRKHVKHETLEFVVKKFKDIYSLSLKYARGKNLILIVMFKFSPNLTAKILNFFRR